MDKSIEITLLYDIYGRNLTKKQQEIFEEYYLYNLSLREIAENKNISYQAVRDSIKTSELVLKNLEDSIGMYNLTKNVKEAYNICKNSNDLNIERTKLIELLK